MNSVLKDISSIGGKETFTDTTALDTIPRTFQSILGDLAEYWLVTLDNGKIKPISLFLFYDFLQAFSFY